MSNNACDVTKTSSSRFEIGQTLIPTQILPEESKENEVYSSPSIDTLSEPSSDPKVDNTVDTNETRFNEINLQMLSSNLYKQIFGSPKNTSVLKDILSIKQELANFGINTEDASASVIPDVKITIPNLKGKNIEEHFEIIANEQVEPYKEVIKDLLNEVPPLPTNFVFKDGWTRYSESGSEPVEFPHEEGLIFDVEVCVKNGPLPVLATAVSKNAWYSWVSKDLIEGTSTNFMNKRLTPESLIPIESSKNDEGQNLNKFQQKPKIVIGHNVSFDRIRIKEQYWLNESGTRFLDTMSLHVCISGTSSYQRAALKSKNETAETSHLHTISSLNNLADVYKLYCGKKLDKSERDIFVTGSLSEIKNHFQELMMYCASDVKATHEVLQKVFPIYSERFPHPATLAGMLELGSAYLPVNYNWSRYLEESETTYNDLNLESKACLSRKADQVCRLLKDEKYKEDPWMWNEDWSIKDLKMKKGYEKIYANTMKAKKELENDAKEKKKLKAETEAEEEEEVETSPLFSKFEYLNETKQFLPKKMPHMPGYPNWYRKLCSKENLEENVFPKAQKISTSMLITPKLLNLTWKCHPLYHIDEHGWGFLVLHEGENSNQEIHLQKLLDESMLSEKSTFKSKKTENNLTVNDQIINVDDRYHFLKLPHKNGVLFNVGNPLSKDFLTKFSDNVLSGNDASALRILEISKMSSYWKNNRDRIFSQLVIWLDSQDEKKAINNLGAIIPQIIAAGTLTRRAVESTWMTVSNARTDRIGSEMRAMVNAPPNYSVVGADVDSQELWIASVLGDAFTKSSKIQGGTPISWMTLIGNKANGSDMHSVTAKAINISRDQAKIINYARIYGAGQRFSERLLKQFNPTMSNQDALSKSKQMFSMTKGQKLYRLKKEFISESFTDKFYSGSESFKIARIFGKPRNECFERGKWVGGSESAMFNSLEEIAGEQHPATPFLNARLSRALEEEIEDKNLPTKINWVVQSSAVDFLHLILVCMRWLMKDKARLCLTFHDEVRYLVPSKVKYNAAVAMHVTNLLVRSLFVSKLKMQDLPMSVAFFTSVEIDSALRKEASQDCNTPSNPQGLQNGYGIPHGESLNVWDAISKSKGCVGVLPVNLPKIPKNEES